METGLASPSVQNRNRSIRTLQEWPRGRWPDRAEGALRITIDAEVVPKVRGFAEDVLRGDVPLDESWRRAIEELRDQPELARLAQEVADSEPAERLRARGSWTSLVIWGGAYDTEPWDGAHVSVGYSENGFTVTLSEGRDAPIESHDGLASSIALENAVRLLRRL